MEFRAARQDELDTLSYLQKIVFRPDEDVKTYVSLNKIIEEVLVFIGKQLREFKIKTVLDLDNEIPEIYASGNQLKQVLLNMIMNSKAAMPHLITSFQIIVQRI